MVMQHNDDCPTFLRSFSIYANDQFDGSMSGHITWTVHPPNNMSAEHDNKDGTTHNSVDTCRLTMHSTVTQTVLLLSR